MRIAILFLLVLSSCVETYTYDGTGRRIKLQETCLKSHKEWKYDYVYEMLRHKDICDSSRIDTVYISK